MNGLIALTHPRWLFRCSLRLRRIALSSSSGEADPPVERVVLNALGTVGASGRIVRDLGVAAA